MIFYSLSCIGLTFIIKYGVILNWARKPLLKINFFNELLNCSLCIGFWSGVFIGPLALIIESDIRYILMPLISAGICWFCDCVIGVLQSIEIFLDNKYK